MGSIKTSLPTIWTDRREIRGFTLIELLVVIALIALITALIVPSISSYFQISMNSAGRELGTAVKDAYNSTVLTGRVYRVAYDLKSNEYWVESGPSNVLLDTESSKKKADERKLHSRSKNEPDENPFSMDRTITRKKVSLPRGVVFDDVVTQQSKDPIKQGVAYTHFFPHGITEQTIIHLIDSSNHKESLVISPLIGRTDVYDRYVTPGEAFGKK